MKKVAKFIAATQVEIGQFYVRHLQNYDYYFYAMEKLKNGRIKGIGIESDRKKPAQTTQPISDIFFTKVNEHEIPIKLLRKIQTHTLKY